MKTLIFGPSGSGKTYNAKALQKLGINAFDADEIRGLACWFNSQGKRIANPATADEAINNHYSFLWRRSFLAKFLSQYNDIFLFGGAGNIFNIIDLFDKVFFLQIDSETQNKRLLNSERDGLAKNSKDNSIVIWGDWFEQEAKKRNIPFIDASLSPLQVFEVIKIVEQNSLPNQPVEGL